MTDKEIMQYIDKAVEKTVTALKKNGALKDSKYMMYNEVSYMLTAYYQNGERVPRIDDAIQNVSGDKYFDIIPKYYGNGQSVESIAAEMNVDISTIVRNKKRLCMEIYVSLKA